MTRCDLEWLTVRLIAGELNEPELASYLQHIRLCDTCQAILRQNLAMQDSMTFYSPKRRSSSRLWRRIESHAGNRSPVREWTRVVLLAGAVAIIGIGFGSILGQHHLSSKRQVVAAATLPGGHSQGQLIMWHPGQRTALSVARLPVPPTHEVYAVWVVSAKSSTPLGILNVTHGRGNFSIHRRLVAGDRVVVCVEPPRGVGRWVGTIILRATVPKAQ